MRHQDKILDLILEIPFLQEGKTNHLLNGDILTEVEGEDYTITRIYTPMKGSNDFSTTIATYAFRKVPQYRSGCWTFLDRFWPLPDREEAFLSIYEEFRVQMGQYRLRDIRWLEEDADLQDDFVAYLERLASKNS